MNTLPLKSFVALKYWPTWLGLAILKILSILPLPILSLIGNVVGLLFYALVTSRRRIAYRNIRSCFAELSDRECHKINRKHFQNSGQLLFTSGQNWWISRARFNRMVTVTNREHYDRALAQGKNVILLAPHFVSMDVAGLKLSMERPMISMYQYSKNKLIDQITIRGRSRFGGLMVERKEPLRKLIRLIRQGNPFYYLPDQDGGRKGIFVPFFNELASTVPVLGKFASLTDAVVIPCTNKLKPWGMGYEVVLGEPIQDFPVGDDIQDTAKMNEVVAAMIRQNPTQYFWAHKRFKTRPKGAPAFYKD